MAVGGLVALAPGRVIRAIAPPESDTEPASAWKEMSAKFVSDILYGAAWWGEAGLGLSQDSGPHHNMWEACIRIRHAGYHRS